MSPSVVVVTKSITAAVGATRKVGSVSYWNSPEGGKDSRTVQQQIRDFDQFGVGVLGYYLDFSADLTSQLVIKAAEWSDAKFVYTENDVVLNIVRNIRSEEGGDLQSIVHQMARELATIGEVVLVRIPTEEGTNGGKIAVLPADGMKSLRSPKGSELVGWPPIGVSDSRSDLDIATAKAEGWIIADRTEPVEGVEREFPFPHRVYVPGYTRRGAARITLQRALPDLRRVDRAAIAMHSATNSAIVNTGVLWFKGSPDELKVDANGLPIKPLGKLIFDMIEHAKKAVSRVATAIGAFPTPIVSMDKPEFIKVGEVADATLINLKKDALEDFSRSVTVPMSVIMDGPGAAAKLMNEWLQDKATRETMVLPKANIIAQALTVVALHPELIAAGINDINRWKLLPDQTKFLSRDPEFVDLVEGVKMGALKRSVLTDFLNKSDHVLELPDGVTEWDHFVALTGADYNRSRTTGKDGGTPYSKDENQGKTPDAVAASLWWQKPGE